MHSADFDVALLGILPRIVDNLLHRLGFDRRDRAAVYAKYLQQTIEALRLRLNDGLRGGPKTVHPLGVANLICVGPVDCRDVV